MSPKAIREYLTTLRAHYTTASRTLKHQILTEVCAMTGYHRKAAIRTMRRPLAPHASATG